MGISDRRDFRANKVRRALPVHRASRVLPVPQENKALPESKAYEDQWALMVLSGGGVLLVQGSGEAGEPIVAQSATQDVVAFASVGATRYDQAVLDLVQVLEVQRDLLDPETVETIEQNLAIIDRAIARSLEALRDAPKSEYLRSHLEQTMRQKLTLLQHATTIPHSL